MVATMRVSMSAKVSYQLVDVEVRTTFEPSVEMLVAGAPLDEVLQAARMREFVSCLPVPA